MVFTRRAPAGWLRFRVPVAVALVALLLAGTGLWLLAGTARHLSHKHVVVGGVPLDEVHPSRVPAGERRPGVVVAHGFAGSARLMAQFGDTLAARGYVVVLLDFSGHGANTRPLPDGTASTDDSATVLQRDLDTAMTHLRGLPDVDPSRVAVAGHSMGATAVTRYAADHPEVMATVAMSLPDSSVTLPDRTLLLVGGLEFPAFHAAAEDAVERGSSGRSAVVVPGVEHISILYAPRTHRELVGWLDDSFGGPIDDRPIPLPMRRLIGAGLLLLALLAGLYPVARLALGDSPPNPVAPPVLGESPSSWARFAVPQIGRSIVVAAVAAGVAVLVAPLAPTNRLPLALGGFIVGFTIVAGAAMLAYQRWRRDASATAPIARTGGLRVAVAAPVLIGYAAITIAVPLHLGVTHAVPVGARWWLLASVWLGLAVLAYAAERVSGGNSFGVLAVSVVAVMALGCAAVVGLAPGFLLLVVPLLAVLLFWQAMWSAVLHRFAAPAWLIALVGSLLVAWPIATALPVIG